MENMVDTINSIFEFVDELEGLHNNVKRICIDERYQSDMEFDNEIKNDGSNIVLKSETFLELGNPSTGSCAYSVYSADEEKIKDGEIIVVGEDIQESRNQSLPFGQVILARGTDLNGSEFLRLLNYTIPSDLIKGLMIKSTIDNIWCRVSTDAAKKGLDFNTIGKQIMKQIKIEFPEVEAVSVIFMTSKKADIIRLKTIGQEIYALKKEVKRKLWSDRGVDIFQCGLSGHCGDCKEKDICDEIRDIEKGYKKARITDEK
jgi:CO dehydrogenase/acetyl-CoA synthase beta subunit